jgi:hypothetical protein
MTSALATRTADTAPLRALLACETRRLWRSTLPWLFVVAVPALFALSGHWQAPAMQRHLPFLLYLSLVTMAFSAFAASTIQRDRRSHADEIILAWPVSSRRLYLARTMALGSLTLVLWLEVALPSLAYTALSYATAAQAAGVAVPTALALRDGSLIALSLAASFLGAQATGQAAAALLPGWPGLVALVLYRACSLAGPSVILAALQWPYALLTSPEFVWNGWAWLSEYLGLGLFSDVFAAHQAFWVLGSLGLLVALACLFRLRRVAPAARSRLFAGAALLAAAVSALPFITIERGLVASHARAVAAYGAAVGPAAQPAAPAPQPLRYELAIDLSRPPEAEVEATLAMVAGPEAVRDSITLTLRRALTVDEVRLDGVAVPFAREGDLLRLLPTQPPATGRPFAVELRYHGRVADWRLDPHEVPAALVAGEFVWLPSTWGWYPVPGEHRLTWQIGTASSAAPALADRTMPFNDAEPTFDVTVRAPAGIRFLAGFAQDGEGAWHLQATRNQLTLLGGNWWPRGEGVARYAVPFEELDTWQAGAEALEPLLAALADWTGIEPLAVVPSPLRFTTAGDAALIMSSHLSGDVFEVTPTRQSLRWPANRWVYEFLRTQPRFAAPATPGQSAAHRATAADLNALRAYVADQVVADAFGPSTSVAPLEAVLPILEASSAARPRVEAWAARTPRTAQKEVLRRLFRDAQRRALVPADLAFLDEEVSP